MMTVQTQSLELAEEYPLSPDQIAEFRRDGHTVSRGLCLPEEIAVYRPAINEAAGRFNTETRSLDQITSIAATI